jgi:hypothetical protein
MGEVSQNAKEAGAAFFNATPAERETKIVKIRI